MRKAAKRLRYAVEPLVPVAGKPAARLAKAHEAVQSVLGDHQDRTVTRVELRSLSDRATGAGVNASRWGCSTRGRRRRRPDRDRSRAPGSARAARSTAAGCREAGRTCGGTTRGRRRSVAPVKRERVRGRRPGGRTCCTCRRRSCGFRGCTSCGRRVGVPAHGRAPRGATHVVLPRWVDAATESGWPGRARRPADPVLLEAVAKPHDRTAEHPTVRMFTDTPINPGRGVSRSSRPRSRRGRTTSSPRSGGSAASASR